MLDHDQEKQLIELLGKVHTMLIIERESQITQKVISAVEKLDPTERHIIMRKYLDLEADYTHHYEIYHELGMADLKYSKIRKGGLQKIHDELKLKGISLD